MSWSGYIPGGMLTPIKRPQEVIEEAVESSWDGDLIDPAEASQEAINELERLGYIIVHRGY
ncbi:hypothetical protein ELTIGER69_70 [Mycobacterium phage ElTiger69]|uniref:Uncharacterized protein n=1 Tax=Mycobacterium phage Naca TaxID=2126816 RepID=A0A2P1N2G4_9CAUD|nr:hypothetical protein KIP48_gp26 [Mycobacterium phage Naca]AFN37672.1 hypothetical protein ELTIGER69_70 [Mycobacterium phage ElTiger69]AVP42104.1 hypothetical protein SEA_NACA_67 [Mycobacterium phage Naca]